MVGLETKKTKECHFTPKIFSSRDGRKRKWHRQYFCPSWQQRCTFFKAPWFCVNPPWEVGLTQNLGGYLAKILTTSFFYFLFFKNISKWPQSLMTWFFIHLQFSSLKTTRWSFEPPFFLLHVSLGSGTILLVLMRFFSQLFFALCSLQRKAILKMRSYLNLKDKVGVEECPKHHGHKGNSGVTPGTCGDVGEMAQVILVWVRALDVGNASHPRRLGVTMVRLCTTCSSCHEDSRILKNTSNVLGQCPGTTMAWRVASGIAEIWT